MATRQAEQAAAGRLRDYHARRDFSKTGEPVGGRAPAPADRPRFVVQKHAARRLHYDLRLEVGGVFRSWAVPRGPSVDPHDKRLAVEVEDHPLEYGDFEGVIPAGQYGAGTVQLWDRGYWQPVGDRPPARDLAAGQLKFELHGERLRGGWTIVRMDRDRRNGGRDNWLLIKHADRFAQAGRGAAPLKTATSVASGRPLAAIAAGRGRKPRPFMSENRRQGRPVTSRAKGRLPDFIEPQLCKTVTRPPQGEEWGHEIKFDGYRTQLRVVAGEVTLRTRKGLDWTERFPAIAAAARSLPDLIADGEIIALDAADVPSFAALQAALSARKTDALIFFLFDLLYTAEGNLRSHPLNERKRRLHRLLEEEGIATAGSLRYVEHFETAGEAVLRSACKLSLEGIISKRLDDPYRSGRGTSWLKSKCRGGQEVVIGGWSEDAGRIRSLLAGIYRDGRLQYVGRVGTGFGAEKAGRLVKKLGAIGRPESPFAGPVPAAARRGVRWVEPRLVAEIESAGWTAAGNVRQASFKGLREDKPAREVTDEIFAQPGEVTGAPAEIRTKTTAADRPKRPRRKIPPAGSAGRPPGRKGSATVAGVSLSSPDKALWPAEDGHPALTKLDLARYFEEVAGILLPHVAGRPCSIVRAPDGIGRQTFFQRHAMSGLSNLLTLTKIRGDAKPYLQVDRMEALIALAQMAALELHPWNCRPGEPEVPGRLVFDIDPGPGIPFAGVVGAAREIRSRLQHAGLTGWCKTTGGKGLHVVVPLRKERNAPEWDLAKRFAATLCRSMAADSPADYVVEMTRGKRKGKIFLDYLRNARTATAVAVLSPRARPGATVSMPLKWTQVRAGLNPGRYTVHDGRALLRGPSPWEGYADSAAPLRPAFRRLTGSRLTGS